MHGYEHLDVDFDAPQRQQHSPGVDVDAARAARALLAGRADAAGRTGVLRLQREAGTAGVSAALEEERSPVHNVVSSGGAPLDRDVRTDMESRLGHDFSDVRVHADGAAHASAQAVDARAYTVGSHVVFSRDTYDPSTADGRRTLAHELTHVVQQRSGPVDGTPAAGGISVSDPSDRFERDAAATAERAMAGPAPIPSPVAQRQEATPEEEEEPAEVQTLVQRQTDHEEEEEPPAG